MRENRIRIRHRSQASTYDVRVTRGILGRCGEWARDCVGTTSRSAVVVSNPTVFSLYGKQAVRSLKAAGFKTSSWLMNDGERYKNLRSAEAALNFFSSQRLSREDSIVALGGGAVGDLAGFAAAVYLRGIRFLQIPTTLLAMIDSSVGGKTGVNSAFGKNLVGSFHQPSGVLIDVEVLRTLPRREMTGGFCEAIKQGALAGNGLFANTADYLERFPSGRSALGEGRLVGLIADQVRFKASIVSGDEQEATDRHDARSRKILNFGHTFGHALEKVTKFRRFRHGEAVGHGLRFAAELSKNLEILDRNELKLLYDVLHRAGSLPSITNIAPRELTNALKFDKKSMGGSLQWVLLEGIGKPVIVSGEDVPQRAIAETIKTILKN